MPSPGMIDRAALAKIFPDPRSLRAFEAVLAQLSAPGAGSGGSWVTPLDFGAKCDGINDDGPAIAAALAASDVVFFPIQANPYRVATQITITGAKRLVSEGATIQVVTAAATAAFKNSTVASAILYVHGLRFIGAASVFDMRNVGGSAPGLALYCDRCAFDGGVVTTGAKVLRGRQIDFVRFADCRAVHYDTIIDIASDFSVGDRDNTQIHVDNFYIANVNLGVSLQQCDKVVLRGLDVATCAAGVSFANTNKRTLLLGCHVESFGATGYTTGFSSLDGYAYRLPDTSDQDQIELAECSAFPLSATDAKAALYQGTLSSNRTDVTLRNCLFSASSGSAPSYKAIITYGQLKWYGEWPFTGSQVTLGDDTVAWADVVIDDGIGYAAAQVGAVLPGAKAISLLSSQGTTTVTADPDEVVREGWLVTLTGNAERYCTVDLKAGWHTLIVTGYRKTGTPYVYIQEHNSPFSTLLRRQINGPATFEKVYRLPFYVSTAATVRVGCYSFNNASCVIGSLGVFQGHASELPETPSIASAEKVPSLPTAAAGWWGRIVMLAVSGSADIAYVCARDAGGAFSWKQIQLI